MKKMDVTSTVNNNVAVAVKKGGGWGLVEGGISPSPNKFVSSAKGYQKIGVSFGERMTMKRGWVGGRIT